jgi:hypothetical protein
MWQFSIDNVEASLDDETECAKFSKLELAQ